MTQQPRWMFVFLAIGLFITFQFGIQTAQAATPIMSGETLCESLDVSELHIYEFFGEAGDRILIDADITGGHPYFATDIVLIDPDFMDEAGTLCGDLLDHVLQKTGTYTIMVRDCDLNHAGTYCLTLINLTSGPLTSAEDPDGGPLASGETRSGGLIASDMDAYQFYGEAGDRVLIDADITGGHPYVATDIVLIDPDFIDEASTSCEDLLDHTLQKTGLYTIVVRDCSLHYYGTYNITLINLTAGPLTSAEDPDGGPLASGETRNGGIIASDMDVYQFYGEAGDRVLIDADITGGHPYVTTDIVLIDPDFIDEASTSCEDLLDHVLLKTGLYTIVVRDCSLQYYGTYNITLLKLIGAPSSSGDCDGGLINPGETRSGGIIASDMDAYQFYGEAGDRVLIDADITGGHPYVTTDIVLIDPDFIDEASTSCEDLLDHVLLKTGLYTIVVRDCSLQYYGTYNISLTKLPDTIRPGIYNPSPATDCDQSEDGILTWDPVAGATGYDVFFGTDVVAPLETLCTNIPSPSCAVANLEKSEVYYWTVVAHTAGGDIQGTVNWFVTELPCDLNHDCSCNILDYQTFIEDWGSTTCGSPPGSGNPPNDCECDLDTNGKCNILDYQVFIQDWGRTICP